MATGSAVAMIGLPNLRAFQSNNTNSTKGFHCNPDSETEATRILSLALMGIVANIILMCLILSNKHLRQWSQGLLFHQGVVDCGRAAILLPLGFSILHCEPIYRCSLIETGFLLLVTVSTINMLTTVLNDSPIFPEEDNEEDFISGPLLMDSPQCVLFGTFMIWFASITINLGPTFLSGGLAARSEMIRNAPSCPLIHGPFRHYILNALWIFINLICVLITLFHLHKLHRDLTKANVEAVKVAGLVTTLVNVTSSGGPIRNVSEDLNSTSKPTSGIRNALEEHQRMRNYLSRIEREGIQKVKMFLIITTAYMIFWGPLFFVTLVRPKIIPVHEAYEVALLIAYVHAFVNPLLFLLLHRGLRHAAISLCFGLLIDCVRNLRRTPEHQRQQHQGNHVGDADFVAEVPQSNLFVLPPPPPHVHTPTPIAQPSQSINKTFRQCAQDVNVAPSVKQQFSYDVDIEEATWRSIIKSTLQKVSSVDHTCHHMTSSQPPLPYHLNSTIDGEVQYSEYSSSSG